MKLPHILTFLFLFLESNLLFAQVTFTEFPEDMQLYSRNESNTALVDITGIVQDSDYEQAVVKLFSEDNLSSTFVVDDLKAGLDLSFQIPIEAQLTEYTLEFWLKKSNDSLLVKSAQKVLCGDTFIIYGQSNAVSYANYLVLNDSISKKYTRNYTHYLNNSHSTDGWHDATFPEVGTLGKWFIKNFTEKEKIPILVINAALGGTDLKYLSQRNPDFLYDVHTPYGLMLKRVFDSKVKSIKGFIFLQGEAEANTSLQSVDEYPALFDTFKKNLSLDVPPIDRYYVYQLGIMNTHALWEAGKLREFKRQLTRVYDDVSVVPATGFGFWDFDGLHYSLGGYGIIAKWLFNSYLAFEKGEKKFETPDLQKLINLKDENRLKLVFNQEITVKDSINFGYYSSLMRDHFYAGRVSGFINGIEREGKNLYLRYDNLPTNSLTYLPGFFSDPEGKPYGGPFIKNRLGTPALTFYEVEIQDELPKPIIDKSVSEGSVVQLFINEARAKECKECELEISYLTDNGRVFLKSIPSENLKIDLPKTDFENLDESNVLILRYSNSLSESAVMAYSLSGEEILDADEDGIPDNWDNCNETKNFEQTDFDKDGIGDSCDSDADGDLVPDQEDNCLFQSNPQEPELVIIDSNKIYSTLTATQYHWVVNGVYSETTNDNLYIVRDSSEYAVFIADKYGCNSVVSEGLRVFTPDEILLLGSQEGLSSIVYPIPTQYRLNYISAHKDLHRAELYTMSGKLLTSYRLNGDEGQLYLNKVSDGTYLLVFYDSSNKILFSRKIVKRN
ncbi:thrombospondin type 3 repeat-containing protein [uncultured Arcticibacterium sp.]|uniref:thrombospondin type 3 repeat-containing protein n=1 Tax=uncultured Arcticibacterium sp. TaxID=2173042 RepID=UPI0030F4B429